jgi:hypothetical protein
MNPGWLWVCAFGVIVLLIGVGLRAWNRRIAPELPEAHEYLRLWLEEWILVDDILQAAYSVRTARPEGVKAIRERMGQMSYDELRMAAAAFLQHRDVRRQVAKYMVWRHALPKAAVMRKLNELSEPARA